MNDDEETALIKRASLVFLYLSILLALGGLSCNLSDLFFLTNTADSIGERLIWGSGACLVIGWMPPIDNA